MDASAHAREDARELRLPGNRWAEPPRLVALLDLVELDDALEEIDRLGDSVSPLLADYALTLAAVVPLRRRHDRIPWLTIEGTACDGRDGARLRAAAVGSSAALGVAVDATPVGDEALRTAMARAMRAVAGWGHEHERGDRDRLERFGRYFDSLVTCLGSPAPNDEPAERTLVRGVRDIVHGAIAGERVIAEPRDGNAAAISISSFARVVHHAVGVTREMGDAVLDRTCAGAIHGLAAMAAVA